MAKKPTSPLPEDDNKTFITEVDDALREERLKHIWDSYKTVIIGGVILLFAVVAGKEILAAQRYSAAQEAANAYADAQAEENNDALAAISTSKSPFAPLAALDLADAARDAGDIPAAAAHYTSIAENKKLPVEIRDLGRYYAALVQLESDMTAAGEHLSKLTGGNSPYRLSALELQARLFMAKGERATAATFYEEIAATVDAPSSLRQRAQQALANLK